MDKKRVNLRCNATIVGTQDTGPKTVFGETHKSAEHAYQLTKAIRSGDFNATENIRIAPTALEAKRIGDKAKIPEKARSKRNGKFVVICHQNHGASGGHFHCPSCKKIIKKKENAKLHIAKCSETERDDSGPNVEADVAQDSQNGQSEHSYSRTTKQQQAKNSFTKKPCPICKKLCHPRWLKKHVKIHNKKKDEITENRHNFTVLVDSERGIFCSAINLSGPPHPVHVIKRTRNLSGPPHPVHVIKRTSGVHQDSFCDNNTCIDMKDTASRGGNPAFECPHVRSTSYAVKGKSIDLREESLTKIQKENFMTKERCDQLRRFMETTNDESPFLVELPSPNLQSDRYIYLSIVTGQKRYWCKTGRTVVTIDKQQKSFTCQCSEQSKYCIHKAVGKWFASQEVQHLMSSCQTPEQPDEESSNSNQNQLRIFEYIFATKKIPELIPKEVYEETSQQNDLIGSSSRKLYPSEDMCHRCNGGLASELAKHKSKIVHLNKIIPDVAVYHKICPRCNTKYRYQEWSNGIHNYNDSLFLGLDVCLFIRDGLLNHVAMGRTLAILQEMIGTNLNVMEIEKAYLHFEAMTDREYEFHCVLCGYSPAIIIWDTFRKASFRHVVSDLPLPNEEVNETVNMKNFWQQVESCIVKRGIEKDLAKQDEVIPNYGFWSPWIGKYTRKDDVVYNTEFKKCPPYAHDDIDECIPEETLFHLLMHEKTSAIKRMCRELGVKQGNSSVDMILKLRDLSINRSQFDLAYEKVFGCTGGWAVGSCRHGVVYCIKNLLRCESPRDYVDMERGLKHRPTVSISDVAHLMAKHGNKMIPSFYHPNEGRIAPVTEGNIKQAEEKRMFNISCLAEKEDDYRTEDSSSNPITGSKSHFSLFDWFHQDNCRKEEEVLRKSSLVSEIAGLIDTQAVEQLFSSCKKDIYFMNNLSPTNHLFVFRLICHLRNQKKNSLVKKRQLEVFGTLHQNMYGQVCGGVDVASNSSYNSGPISVEISQVDIADSPVICNVSSILDVADNNDMAYNDPEIQTSTGGLVITPISQQPRNPLDEAMEILQMKVCPYELLPQ
ncbi:uncharacterized protein LOC134262628 [Saccostrea cucullata]|uniref:uncharacterized protein LOC134262628 n=1 Tax=Saccostrea cuccullata TaxID=36930 RepID=UPI002ED26DC3